MMEELIDAFDRADADDAVRAVIVTGAGPRLLRRRRPRRGARPSTAARPTASRAPTGADGKSTSATTRRDGGGRVTLRIFECQKPVIAAINGPAVGVGVTMTLPMDIRIAADDGALRLRVRAPRHRAGGVRQLVPAARGRHQPGAGVGATPGGVFPAEEALAGRPRPRVVPPSELLARRAALAREIADNTAPVSVALSRQMLWRMLGADHPMEAHKVDSRGIYARGASATRTKA